MSGVEPFRSPLSTASPNGRPAAVPQCGPGGARAEHADGSDLAAALAAALAKVQVLEQTQRKREQEWEQEKCALKQSHEDIVRERDRWLAEAGVVAEYVKRTEDASAAPASDVVRSAIARIEDRMGTDVTPEEMQSRFLQEGAGLLSYSGLNTFFGGLAAKIGEPHPDVGEEMRKEHCERPDSNELFTTGNFGVTTTSAIEHAFVTSPESPPAGLGFTWPSEAKLDENSSRRRKPMAEGEVSRPDLDPAESPAPDQQTRPPPLSLLFSHSPVFASSPTVRSWRRRWRR